MSGATKSWSLHRNGKSLTLLAFYGMLLSSHRRKSFCLLEEVARGSVVCVAKHGSVNSAQGPQCVAAFELLKRRGLANFDLQDVEWSKEALCVRDVM